MNPDGTVRHAIALLGSTALLQAVAAANVTIATTESAMAEHPLFVTSSERVRSGPDELASSQGTPAKAGRPISSKLATQLAAMMPKDNSSPVQADPMGVQAPLDRTPGGKQENGVIELPKFVVREQKGAPSDDAFYTEKGRNEIAMKRYLSETYRALNFFTLPLYGTPPEMRARGMQAEDERLKNMREFSDLARMIGATNQAAGDFVKREVDKTFIRSSNSR
jgi:hypothetical protein